MKLALILLISLLCLNTFSQGVQVYEARPAGAIGAEKKAPQESTSDEDFEALERELAEQNKKLGSAGSLLNVEEDKPKKKKQDEAGDPIGQNQELFELQAALNEGKSPMDIIKDPALRKKLIKAYEINPMSQMPKEALREMLVDQIQGSPLGTLTKQFPIILNFLVNFMHHPTALGQAVKILDRPDDLRLCGFVSLVLMVLIYFLRRGFLKDDPPIGKVIGVKLVSSLIFLTLSFGFLYFTFLDELDPLIEVFKQSV
jgi:hypothetical protein